MCMHAYTNCYYAHGFLLFCFRCEVAQSITKGFSGLAGTKINVLVYLNRGHVPKLIVGISERITHESCHYAVFLLVWYYYEYYFILFIDLGSSTDNVWWFRRAV